jgi:hypothetical protein
MKLERARNENRRLEKGKQKKGNQNQYNRNGKGRSGKGTNGTGKSGRSPARTGKGRDEDNADADDFEGVILEGPAKAATDVGQDVTMGVDVMDPDAVNRNGNAHVGDDRRGNSAESEVSDDINSDGIAGDVSSEVSDDEWDFSDEDGDMYNEDFDMSANPTKTRILERCLAARVNLLMKQPLFQTRWYDEGRFDGGEFQKLESSGNTKSIDSNLDEAGTGTKSANTVTVVSAENKPSEANGESNDAGDSGSSTQAVNPLATMAFGKENGAGGEKGVQAVGIQSGGGPDAFLSQVQNSGNKRTQQLLSETPVIGKLWLLLDMLCAFGQNPHQLCQSNKISSPSDAKGQKEDANKEGAKKVKRGYSGYEDDGTSSCEYQRMLFELFQATDLLIEGLSG